MDVRDRAEELAGIRQKEGDEASGGTELIARITEEELWACTSCQACIEACPILISPMGIILDMRRNLIMEESKSPESLTSMFNNVENNGAPWAFPLRTVPIGSKNDVEFSRPHHGRDDGRRQSARSAVLGRLLREL